MKNVLCPICKSCHNHIAKVQVFIGKDEYQTTSDVLITNKGNLQYFNSPRKIEYRLNGMSVLIDYQCECGNEWKEEIYTHKGSCCREIKT